MQRIFQELETSPSAVQTTALTAALGMSHQEISTQHDASEYVLAVIRRLMEENGAERPELQGLFFGYARHIISSEAVQYRTDPQAEPFQIIHLAVTGLTSLEASLEDHLQARPLSDPYDVPGHGLQPATQTTVFDSFPPILYLQLMRFRQDDFGHGEKVNDRFTFLMELDMAPYLSDSTAGSHSQYYLRSVLVHRGEYEFGHYYAFIRNANEFYRFDDHEVSHVVQHIVLEDSFGGENNTNAYMLVYESTDFAEV